MSRSSVSLEPEAPSLWRTGFTLIELLIVIAIIGILMGLVTAGAQAARRRAAATKTKSMISSLETAIAMYNGDMGQYPKTDNKELVAALTEDPKNPDWNGPYMELKKDDVKDGEVLDAWGRPLVYVSINSGSPEHRTNSFDLYSLGPNGVFDGGVGDDVVNW